MMISKLKAARPLAPEKYRAREVCLETSRVAKHHFAASNSVCDCICK